MKNIIDKAIEHAKEEFPEESCGLVGVKNGKKIYIECLNIAIDKENNFIIDPLDYAKTEDEFEITHIVHSHPKSNPKPSQSDLVSIEKGILPWIIVNPLVGNHTINNPTGYKAPMVGREFLFGVLDCYSIVRDHYLELGIELTDPIRLDKFWERGENLYIDNYKKEGFKKINIENLNDIKINDVILINASSSIPNHAAVYLGEGKMIHHIQDRFSSIDMYGGYWLKNTWGVIRYKDFL